MGAVVHMQVTGADVIHAWTIPAFGVKIDAVPGRLNETWFAAEEEGVYFGQCSELCGLDHSYMPITVKVVSQEQYDAWLDWAIEEYGGTRGDEGVADAPAAARPPRRRPPSRTCSRGAPRRGEPRSDRDRRGGVRRRRKARPTPRLRRGARRRPAPAEAAPAEQAPTEAAPAEQAPTEAAPAEQAPADAAEPSQLR